MGIEMMIRRWGAIDRLTHWLLMIGVTIEIVSGLPLFSANWFGFLVFLWHNRLLGYPLHIFAAVALMGAVGIHIGYRLIKRERSEMWLTQKDLKDLTIIGKHWFGITKEYPELGFHHPGEKFVYWFAAVLGLLSSGLSGLLMWLGPASGLFSLALLVHDMGFVLMTALIAGHFLFSITPGNADVLRAMLVTGNCRLSWAQKHHPLWARKTTQEVVIENGI